MEMTLCKTQSLRMATVVLENIKVWLKLEGRRPNQGLSTKVQCPVKSGQVKSMFFDPPDPQVLTIMQLEVARQERVKAD